MERLIKSRTNRKLYQSMLALSFTSTADVINVPIIPPIVQAPKYLSELGSIFPSGYFLSCCNVAIALLCSYQLEMKRTESIRNVK